jgi:DNA-directed RNA polymerase subunit RPC12/RpoP
MKPWRCRRCQTELGVIEAGELQVLTRALAVRCTRDGTTWVTCPECSAKRAWKPRLQRVA